MKARHGSALLVVLGMLSFMVISGLAFAVYMRTTRLSTSFTRRTVTTRQLAKAALAEAIDQIDRAVANDPHPGVRNPYRDYWKVQKSSATADDDSSTQNSAAYFDPLRIDNVWSHRVLIGQVEEDGPHAKNTKDQLESGVEIPLYGTKHPNGQGLYHPAFVEEDDDDLVPKSKVSVLSLEALAYLPPSIVNEVRYYGQWTPTAQWQSLDFDAGRFAYIAVDVSDFYDVNQLLAHLPRSSDPSARVTLGHVFEDEGHEQTPDTAGWKTLTGQFRDVSTEGELSFDSKVPAVSLADFNLAWGSSTFGRMGLSSPFVNYVDSGGGSGTGFYGSETTRDVCQWESFVTDSLMAARPERERKTGNNKEILDLAEVNNQPFDLSTLTGSQQSRTLNKVARGRSSSGGFQYLSDHLPEVSLCTLSDYLDTDRIPISLGMPSVERVPMICGIKSTVAESPVTVTVKMQADADVPGSVTVKTSGDKERLVTRKVHWRLDKDSLTALLGGGQGVEVLVVYPFRNHEKKDEGDFFQLDGKLQLFFSTEAMPLRTDGRANLPLGADPANSLTAGNVATLCSKPTLVQSAIMEIPLKEKAIDKSVIPFNSIAKPDDCVSQEPLELTVDRGAYQQLYNEKLTGDNGDLLCVTYQWKQTCAENSEEWTPANPDFSVPAAEAQVLSDADNKPSAAVQALQKNGNVAESSFYEAVAGDTAKDLTLYLNLAVTVRVKNKSQDRSIIGSDNGTKTLDLVPATARDDETLNGIANGNSRLVNIGGKGTPLMKFFSAECKINTGTLQDVAFNAEASPKAVMIDDPRYNHAPENWRELSTFSRDGWLAAQSSGTRDGDIFMATSDQGYLQSVYEFAFLPRLSNFEGDGDDLSGYLGTYDGNSRIQLGVGTQPDAHLMWKTHAVFRRGDGDSAYGPDDFASLGLEYDGGRGPRVNPYSDFNSVLMAAFANTPHDWRVTSDDAGQNNPAGANGDGCLDDVAKFNEKHAWNEVTQGNGGVGFSWDMLEDFAGQFHDRVRDGFSHPKGSFVYDEDKDYAIQSKDDDYVPILDDAFDQFFGNATGTDADRYLCNVKLDDNSSSVYSVDKKFLYGYWKSCFAARQQLYLVFFRAEPMMLGGGMSGMTPPQLGAKGVALVWRDPYDPNVRKSTTPGSTVTRQYPLKDQNEDYIPHQTRVLFYKQFE